MSPLSVHRNEVEMPGMKMLVFWILILLAWSWSIASQGLESRSDMPAAGVDGDRPGADSPVADSAVSTEATGPANAQSLPKPPPPPIVIRVSGYGALPEAKPEPSESDRLKAQRASRLDALRNLAERVYGTRVRGSSTVRDFVLAEDSFATQVDTVVRGARVVSVHDLAGKGYETVMELLLPGDFAECLTKANQFRGGQDCFLPLPGVSRGDSEPRRNDAMQRVYYLN
jgi:hypothetical protein